MWVVPRGSVVDCGTVLKSHDVHLVEMKLWDVGVRPDVDMFLRHKGEVDGWLFCPPCCCDDCGDVGKIINGGSIHSDEGAITEC